MISVFTFTFTPLKGGNWGSEDSKIARRAKGAKGYGDTPIVPSVCARTHTREKSQNRGAPLYPLQVGRLTFLKGGFKNVVR